MKLEAEVKRDIRKKLDTLERFGHIMWFERLQSGQIHNGDQHIYMCRENTPDFIVTFINKQNNITVMFVEVKREGIFTTRKGGQTEWVEKYCKKHVDFIHIVAQSVNDMIVVLFKLSKDKLDEIEFNN